MEEGGTWRIGGTDPIEHRSSKFKHNESAGTRTNLGVPVTMLAEVPWCFSSDLPLRRAAPPAVPTALAAALLPVLLLRAASLLQQLRSAAADDVMHAKRICLQFRVP